jgi:hypothetical protein
LFAGETRRAQTRAGFKTDADFADAVEAGENTSRRLGTRQAVRSGSATAQRLIDDGDTVNDAGRAVMEATKGPVGAAWQLAQRGYDAGKRRVAGAEMDALSEYLLAGAPKANMSRDEVAAFLKSMEPMILQRLQQQATRQGGAAGQVAGRVSGSR